MGFFKTIYRCFDVLADMILDNGEYKDTASVGERLTYNELRFSFPKKRILRNVYIYSEDGKLTEIDIVLLTKNGVFVLESKNYDGWIFGDESLPKWTQTFKNGSKYPMPNPIIQNANHINKLRSFFADFKDVNFLSVIVFSDRCKLKSISISDNNTRITHRKHLVKTIKELMDSSDVCFTDDEFDIITEMLSPFSRPPAEIKERHLQELNEPLSRCPRCGQSLVKKTNKYTGQEFMGCKGFPACKYSR